MRTPPKRIKCAFCEKEIASSRLRIHLKLHGKTIRENTLALLGLSESDLPKCRFCDNPVDVGYQIDEICSDEACKQKLISTHRHEGCVKAAAGAIARGTFSSLRKNRKFDENGKDIRAIKINQTRVKNGTHHFQKANRPITADGKDYYGALAGKRNDLAVKNGTFHFLSQNRKKTEDGKDLLAMTMLKNHSLNTTRHIKDHEHLYDKEFLEKTFVAVDGEFDIRKMMEYFNVSIATANYAKRQAGCFIPNHVLWNQEQQELAEFIDKFVQYPEVYQNYRNLIPPREVDFYLPQQKLAIEFDGIYWHSNSFKDAKYHLDKTIACEEQGVQLLHVFEHEWLDPVKREIWKSLIQNKLGKGTRVYARNCQIKEMKYYKAFLRDNHLQGPVASPINYGLYFNDEPVALMTFGKSRFDKSFDYELLRFCVKRGYSVVGGASRLFTHFKRNFTGRVVSYANRRWSNGNLYRTLGFDLIGISDPGYVYVKQTTVLSRYQCQKHRLAGVLGDQFDESLSEKDNMLNAGYLLLYDAGNLKYGTTL